MRAVVATESALTIQCPFSPVTEKGGQKSSDHDGVGVEAGREGGSPELPPG